MQLLDDIFDFKNSIVQNYKKHRNILLSVHIFSVNLDNKCKKSHQQALSSELRVNSFPVNKISNNFASWLSNGSWKHIPVIIYCTFIIL